MWHSYLNTEQCIKLQIRLTTGTGLDFGVVAVAGGALFTVATATGVTACTTTHITHYSTSQLIEHFTIASDHIAYEFYYNQNLQYHNDNMINTSSAGEGSSLISLTGKGLTTLMRTGPLGAPFSAWTASSSEACRTSWSLTYISLSPGNKRPSV